MEHYRNFSGLEDLYLEDSWVIDLSAHPGVFTLSVVFVLRESHSLYTPPLPGEQYCYQRGQLIFKKVESLSWTAQGNLPAVDSSNEKDYGSIDSFTQDNGTYRIQGDFGTINLESTPPKVIYDTAS